MTQVVQISVEHFVDLFDLFFALYLVQVFVFSGGTQKRGQKIQEYLLQKILIIVAQGFLEQFADPGFKLQVASFLRVESGLSGGFYVQYALQVQQSSISHVHCLIQLSSCRGPNSGARANPATLHFWGGGVK